MPDAPSILIPPVFGKGLLFGDVEQPKQGIFEVSETQKLAVSAKLEFNDGRIYRYNRNGGVLLAKGLMNSGPAVEAKLEAETQSTSGTAVEVDDVEIVVDITTALTLAENALAEGTLYIESGLTAGLGDDYPIIASKLDSSDDTLLRLRLRYPIRTAWDASTVITIKPSPHWNTVVFPATAESAAVGVNKVAVPINYFYWGQTGGPCAMLVDNGDTLVKGDACGAPSTAGAAGEVGNQGTTDQIWGRVLHGIAGDSMALVYLTLDT